MGMLMPSVTELPVLEVKRRAKNYWDVDGLPTLVGGVFCLLFVVLLPPYVSNSYAWAVFGILLPLFILAGLWIGTANREGYVRGGSIVEWLKERITYPRTGYVEDPADPALDPSTHFTLLSINAPVPQEPAKTERLAKSRRTRAMRGLYWLGSLAMMEAIFARNDWFWIAEMLCIGALGVLSTTNKKFVWIDIFGLSLALLALIIVPMNHESRIAIVFGAPGVVWTLRGALTLLHYLRQNPVAQA